MRQPNYRRGFELTLHESALSIPYDWKKLRRIFVNSMGDLFHMNVPLDFIHQVFSVMNGGAWRCYQILTKRSKRRSKRLRVVSSELGWAPHIWMGVSVESANHVFRIDHLRCTRAHIKFPSLEPLLGPLPKLDLREINWVIVGGESGPGARLVRGVLDS
jgi:protein gp37